MPRTVESLENSELVRFARDEVQKFQAGQINRFSHYSQLSTQFGFSCKTIESYLGRTGVTQERGIVLRERYGRNIRSDRRAAMLDFARAEVERFRAGETQVLPSTAEFSTQFGYSPKTVYDFLSKAGLTKEKKIAKQERQGQVLGSRMAQNLASFVHEEIINFRAGEISSIIPIEELITKFGYSRGYISRILRITGLREERQAIQAENTRLAEIFTPSSELAWILGVLAGGGSVDRNNGEISLGRSREGLDSTFISVGEKLFKLNVRYKNLMIGGEKECQRPRFFDISLARALGDLRVDGWPHTILERYSWIFKNEAYMWVFLTGIFDTRVSVEVGKNRQMKFNSINPAAISFMLDLFSRVGIRRPFVTYSEGKLSRVTIKNIKDLKFIAENIHSYVPDKEEKLRLLRKQSLKDGYERALSGNEVIAEWTRLCSEVLGHVPTCQEINWLYRQGKTKWTSTTYAYHFGKIADGRKRYSVARQYLINLLPIANETTGVSTQAVESKTRRSDSEEEFIEEYRIARNVTLKEKGCLPTISDFFDLRKSGIISHTGQAFCYRFGNGSFNKTKEYLEAIIMKADISGILQEYEMKTGTQIKYMPKQHNEIDQLGKQKLAEIIAEFKRRTPSNTILYGPTGRSLLEAIK